jgi:hypothetical protein
MRVDVSLTCCSSVVDVSKKRHFGECVRAGYQENELEKDADDVLE